MNIDKTVFEPGIALYETMDAVVWAKEFIRIFHILYPTQEIDEQWMINWFANAIMKGYDAGLKKTDEKNTPL